MLDAVHKYTDPSADSEEFERQNHAIAHMKKITEYINEYQRSRERIDEVIMQKHEAYLCAFVRLANMPVHLLSLSIDESTSELPDHRISWNARC